MPGALAAVIVFLSSAAVLVLEILAGRLLAPYVGVTLETFTGIIGVVLAGIALGTWLGGRLADRIDPRRALPHTLILGGATAIAAVPLIRALGPDFSSSGPTTVVVLSLVGFLAPSALLSAASPLVVKIVLTDLAQTGHVVGRLSAIGTAGSLVGVFVTGFVLIAAFPTTPVILVTGLGLVAGGIALWWWADRRRIALLGVGIALTVLATGSAAMADNPCEIETAYYCARVEVDPNRIGGRTLFLDTLRHSYVDLEDPTHLQFGYIEVFADVAGALEAHHDGAPLRSALHIGGGGFTLPRYLSVTRPQMTNHVLEIDATLVDLARRELGLILDDRLTVATGDARTALRTLPSAGFDLVVGDAFGGLAVPWHLTTREFTREVHQILRPTGVYVLNVVDNPPLAFLRAELATLAAVFEHVGLIAPMPALRGEAGSNFVLIASAAPLPLTEIRGRLDARAAEEVLLAEGEALRTLIGGARVLTDDHAPVDQLITTR